MSPNTREPELRSRRDVRRAVLATPSSPRAQPLADGLGFPPGEAWSQVLASGSAELIVCRVTRSPDDVLTILRLIDAGIPIVLVDRPNAEQGTRAIATLEATCEFDAGNLRRLRRPRPEPVHRDRRIVLPTSGSSGDPKYVSLSAENVISNAVAVAEALRLSDDDIGVTTLSPAYSYGLSNVLAHVVAGGTMLCLEDPITGDRFWEAAGHAGATSLAFAASSAPVVLAAMRRSKLPRTLRRVMFAGGGVRPSLIPELYRAAARVGAAVHLMYGQTEAGPRIAISDPDPDPSDWGTVGAGIGGVRTRVVDSDGNEQPPGQEGRIQIAGPYTMAGYVRAAKDLALPRRGMDWLDTGDRGRRDGGGRLWVIGRAGHERKVSGYRIDLVDVRDQAEDLFGCSSVALAGAHQLTVCLETAGHVPDKNERVAILAGRINLPPGLIRLFVTEEFPRGGSGKVDRRRLEDLAGILDPERGDGY